MKKIDCTGLEIVIVPKYKSIIAQVFSILIFNISTTSSSSKNNY